MANAKQSRTVASAPEHFQGPTHPGLVRHSSQPGCDGEKRRPLIGGGCFLPAGSMPDNDRNPGCSSSFDQPAEQGKASSLRRAYPVKNGKLDIHGLARKNPGTEHSIRTGMVRGFVQGDVEYRCGNVFADVTRVRRSTDQLSDLCVDDCALTKQAGKRG
ncbi:MAG: hypothetical protein R2845_05410 [Thermomicrobiales bacterium]